MSASKLPEQSHTGAVREWKAAYNPERDRLDHWDYICTDGFEEVHVIEKSAYDAVCAERNELEHESKRRFQSIKILTKMNDDYLKERGQLKRENEDLRLMCDTRASQMVTLAKAQELRTQWNISMDEKETLHIRIAAAEARVRELEEVLDIIASSADGSCHADNVYRAKKSLTKG